MGILNSFLILLKPYFNNVNDLPFILKYYNFSKCQRNLYFDISTKFIQSLIDKTYGSYAIGFLFPSNSKELKHDESISVCKCSKDNIFEIIFPQ